MAQFAYNNAPLLTQHHPILHKLWIESLIKVELVSLQAAFLKKIHKEVKEPLTHATITYKAYANMKRREGPAYEISGQVQVSKQQDQPASKVPNKRVCDLQSDYLDT
ncbi:hypothetical protein DSO57_1033360 [Entomophthora muscae]|uniref:Uncharacterized protein n=1 Tax=Entomophthora muscae TaxID=34485 RepID=A0ACC2T0Z6_9FUNG|nr:hypothetical protein DSO57_1033360 [Entomophthora muscae]